VLIDTLLDLDWAKIIFFPHWSEIIPPSIYENHECVMFHIANLPWGRGGSPLQNQIAMGIYDTKISAFRCTEGVDEGPIYMKEPISLYGTAQEIYLRATQKIEDMICTIVRAKMEPKPQPDKGYSFKRRTPEQGNIQALDLEHAFDYIRMLDADGYPRAFLETDKLKIEFSRASYRGNKVIADVEIRRK
jgi:methionyl-tRNA formyltransferase